MNIKPPLWLASPAQVSPRWRWFRELGTHTWLSGLTNLSVPSNGWEMIGSLDEKLTRYGNALEYTDNDLNYIRSPQGILPNELPHHVVVLFRRDVSTNTEVPISLHGGDVSGWRLRVSATTNVIQVVYWGGTGGTSTITVPVASWTLLCAVIESDQISFHIYDLETGVVKRETLTGLSYVNTDGTNDYIYLGRHGGTAFPLDGQIAMAHVGAGHVPESVFDNLAGDPFGPFRQANRLFLPDLPRSFGSVVVPSDTQRQPITIESSGPTDINISEPPERVINGGFDTDSDWTKETGWTISGGVASQSGGNALSSLYNTISGNIVEGKTYRVTFTVVSITSGQVRVELGGGQAASRGTWRTAAGTYTEILTASQTSYAVKSGDTGNEFTGTVDNVSIKEVDVFTITP